MKTVDIEQCIQITGGNRDLALELISMLITSLPEHRTTITRLFTDNEFDALQQEVHRLLGSSRCCGTPALVEASSNVENALLNQETNHLDSHISKLIVEIDAVMQTDLSEL